MARQAVEEMLGQREAPLCASPVHREAVPNASVAGQALRSAVDRERPGEVAMARVLPRSGRFDKTGVRSRRDLVGKVFFSYYEPRLRNNEARVPAERPLRGGPKEPSAG